MKNMISNKCLKLLKILYQLFIVLLSKIVNGSNHTKCVSLSNQKCMIQPNFINLHPNAYPNLHPNPNTVKNFAAIHLRLN